MGKAEFLTELSKALSFLPSEDVQERLAFYGEMIDDRMEEGIPEEEAVAGIGTVDEIAQQIISETPLTKIVKERIRPKRSPRTREIVFAVLGFPVWFPLACAACAVVLALYIVLWALLVSLWAVEAALWGYALACVAVSIVNFVRGMHLQGLAFLGAGLFLMGFSLVLFLGCRAASRGIVLLTKKLALGIKSLFIRKEREE